MKRKMAFSQNQNMLLKWCASTAILVLSSSLNASYKIETFAGTGTAGVLLGDGGLATSAQIGHPKGVFGDSLGNIYITDYDNAVIRKVMALTNNISTVPGYNGGFHPYGLCVDSTGTNIYMVDLDHSNIRLLRPGIPALSTFAGTDNDATAGGRVYADGGFATAADLSIPYGACLDNADNVLIADSNDHVIRKVDKNTGLISKIAGTPQTHVGVLGDNGLATSAILNNPSAVCVDSAGNIYIADTNHNAIRMIAIDGNASLRDNSTPPQKAQTVAGRIYTIAGTSSDYNASSDNATSTNIGTVMGISVDSYGYIYFSDRSNNVIRKISPPDATGARTMTIIAGDGTSGYTGDGGLAIAAKLNSPEEIYVDSQGNVYIADSGNNVIRKLTWVPFVAEDSAPAVMPASSANAAAAAAGSAVSEAVESIDTGGSGGGGEEEFRFSLSPGRIRLGLGMSDVLSGATASPHTKSLHALEKTLGAAKALQKINDSVTIWASGVYSQGQMKQMYTNPASAQKHYGVIVGGHYHHKPTDQLIGMAFDLGFGESYLRSDHAMKNTYHSGQATVYYGLGFTKNWKLHLRGSFMRSKGSHHRPYNNHNSIAMSHSISHASSGVVELAHRFKPSDNFHLTPSVGFNYTHTKQFAYKEENAGGENQSFPAASMNEASIKFGLKGNLFQKLEDHKTYGLYPHISYTRYVKIGTLKQRVVTIQSGQSQMMRSGTPGKDLISMGLGAGIHDKENSTKMQVGYTANFQKYRRSHELSFKYGIEF